VTLSSLIGLPVRHRGITLARVTDVLLDAAGAPVGLAVESVAGEAGFLPWPSAEVGPDEVNLSYPLALLSRDELGYYRETSRSLAAETGDEPMLANG
jgi:hypothetical protein